MARISLLLSLALILFIGSVSAHPPSHKKTVCPPTLSELQIFPYAHISKLLEKKTQNAPATTQFKTLFAVCKAYNNHLEAFKYGSVKAVVSLVHTKYAVITNVFLKAQVLVGVDGEFSVKLRKSYGAMAKGYVKVVEKVGAISAKYNFVGDAKISKNDRAEIEFCVIKLSASIRAYLNVITECSNKISADKKTSFSIGSGGFIEAFVKKGLGFGGKFVGLDAQGQVGAEALGEAKLGGHAEIEVKTRAKVGGHAKAGAKGGVKARTKVGAHAEGEAKVGAKVEGKVGAYGGAEAGAKGGFKVNANAEAGGKIGGKVGGQAGAKAGGKVGAQGEAKHGGLLGGWFLGFGGRGQFDAAGKAHVGGGSEFKPLSNIHNKHID